MAQIRIRDMHPQVRFMGAAARLLTGSYNEKKLTRYANLCRRVLKGSWLGRHSRIREEYIPRPDGSSLRLLICRSKGSTRERATGLLWIHGGGYAMGMPEQDFFFVDPLVADGSCLAVLPDYTLSTEKPYPGALEDCYLTLLWLAEHAHSLGVDPDQLFVGGDSAGGGLAAALCLYARDKKQVKVAFQLPLYPMLDDRPTPSWENNDAPVWDTPSNVAAWKMYLKGLPQTPVYAAPARARELAGIPPMLTYVGTAEPFYHETVSFVENARRQGVTVYFKEYPGCFHAFDMVCAFTRVGKDARKFLRDGFRQAQKLYFTDNNKEAAL